MNINMLSTNMDYNIPQMISIFLEKCCFDKDSTIIEIGPNRNLDLPETLLNGAKIYYADNYVNIDNFCKSNNIERVNLIYFNSIIDIVNMQPFSILDRTEHIIIHENYADGFESILDCNKWTVGRGYEDYAVCKNIQYRKSLIKDNGSWSIKDMNEHFFDEKLSKGILKFFKAKSITDVVDFGCGPGKYVEYFDSNGITIDGYDGNELTPEITNNRCGVIDLSVDFNLNKTYDCVLSLEVGEHIPKEFEETYIDNLIKHSRGYIIISWAIPGQDGYGHVNCQTNEYIKGVFDSKGFKNNIALDRFFRKNSTAPWFKNTIMVFSKK